MLKLERKEQNMKLIDKVLDKKNMELACKQVKKNKGASGIDGMTVDEVEEYIFLHYEEICRQIKERKYQPMPVRRVYIPKENGDKRGLGIPTVIDRVIQQAIVQTLTPIYDSSFSDYSYGFRPNRSCEMAIIKLLEYFNDGYTWVVDIDLEKFFDNVCHDKLISIIMKTIHDGELVSLIRKYLKAGVMENGVIQETKLGTPQGGNLSPLLSNIMLNELDKELEKRGLNFVRYADDCIIVVRSEKAANRVMETVTKYIENKLGLKVNATKSKIARPEDIKYLGFGFYKKEGKYRPKPHLKSLKRLKLKLHELTKRSWSISLEVRISKINSLLRGFINYYKIGDMEYEIGRIGEYMRRRIRCVIWKQWKTPKSRIKALRKLGISEIEAKLAAYSRKSYWRSSRTMTMHKALTNGRLEKKGLISPLKYYQEVHV